MKKEQSRIIGIDVLRGLSILMVVLLHLNIRFGYSNTFLKEVLPSKLFSLLFWSGFYGVVVFFTLSGFLITNSILIKWGNLSNISVKKFYWMRFSRIMPLLFLLLSILSVLHFANIDGFVINPEKTSLMRAIIAVLTFHFNWLEIQVGYLPANWDVLWSISIEESFYLIFPVACLFLKKEWQFAILLILFMVVSPWARTQLYLESDLANKNHFAFLDSIALGCMTALLIRNLKYNKFLNRILLFLGWGMIILVFVFRGFVYKTGLVDLGLNITILSLGISFILFWINENHHSNKEKDYWIFKWLKRMGVYSYEIYLTHMFVVVFGVQIFRGYEFEIYWLVPYSLLLVWLSYVLGKLVFHRFSEPMNRFLREKRLQ